MFSKTWRVHAIFTDIKLNKKLIKDYKLFMVVGVLVFIDVATLTTWQIVDPFYRATSQGKPEPSPQNEDILVIPEMEYCQSKRMTIFLGSIYVYKGLLMAFGIFLAWETRQVSIPALNDSKYIGMSVYNVVIMCVIGAGVSFVLRDQQDAAFVIISIFIIFCSTATLCLVFVPKLIELKRNPNAGDRRVRATLKPFKKSHRDSDEIEVYAKIKLANDDNFRLRQRLKEKSYELEALTYRLSALEESVKHVKCKEVVVEENDLEQIDNCDQRKLSVSNLKVLTQKHRKPSSNILKTQIGHFEVQEESTSPEVIVNSTSIFSLSSEAAQLTVKNGSGHETNSSIQCSKSSDEMSFTFRDNTDQIDGKVSDKVSGCSNESIEQNSLDSDDTSYSKAIKHTIESEVISHIISPGLTSRNEPSSVGSFSLMQPLHYCHQVCQISHQHQCCHYHQQHPHYVHLHHTPDQQPTSQQQQQHQYRSQQQQQSSISQRAHQYSIPMSATSMALYTNDLITPTSSPVPTLKQSSENIESNNESMKIVSNHSKEIVAIERARKKRRSKSFGGFLHNDIDQLPFMVGSNVQQHRFYYHHDNSFRTDSSTNKNSFLGLILTTSTAEIRQTSTSPIRTYSKVDKTLSTVGCVSSGGISSTMTGTSTTSYNSRLFPYLNRSVSIDQNHCGVLRNGQSCPQVRCDIVEYL